MRCSGRPRRSSAKPSSARRKGNGAGGRQSGDAVSRPGAALRQGPSIRFPVNPDEIDDAQRSFIGIPTLWAFSRIAVQGTSHGHYYFSPMIRASAEDMFEINKLIRGVLLDSGDEDLLDRFGWRGGLGSYPKACMLLYEFLIIGDVALNRRRRDIFKHLVEACAARGWAEYRTPPAFQDLVMSQYAFNNRALLRFHEAIKDAIDPNGILAAGKSGIWPKHLRKA
jgi:(+)-pinoresinol hydroxylase